VILRLVTALSLLGVAVVHLVIAGDYTAIGSRPLSLGDQFYAQSATAVVLAGLLLVRPHQLVWLASTGFAAASLAILVYSRYKTIPVPGFPPGFMETWDSRGAKPAAAFEAVALLLSAVGTRQARSS
jgi:hypothetical protein